MTIATDWSTEAHMLQIAANKVGSDQGPLAVRSRAPHCSMQPSRIPLQGCQSCLFELAFQMHHRSQWVSFVSTSVDLVLLCIPRHQTNTCRNRFLREFVFFVRIHAGPVLALTRIQKIFLRNYIFRAFCQILGGIHSGGNTCRACIRTRANTGKTS